MQNQEIHLREKDRSEPFLGRKMVGMETLTNYNNKILIPSGIQINIMQRKIILTITRMLIS